MLGNEAVARGLWEAGCRFVSSYPGTPSTEITEEAALYEEIDAEWAPNEKVAMEAAWGAAVAGARSFCGQKHVGLNVAADPLFTASYTGVNGGLVIGVADDPGMHSSQNEQDSRHYARAAKILMLEPSDSAACKGYAVLAFELSEKFDTPVILRTTTRIAHARSPVETGERTPVPLKPYEKNPGKFLCLPANAQKRHVFVEERTKAQREWAETSGINTVIPAGAESTVNGKAKIGVIAAGVCYQFAREALGDTASYLKLGCVWPLPDRMITEFAASAEELWVAEDLDPYIEEHCKSLGLQVHGKDRLPMCGEYTQSVLRKAIRGEENESKSVDLAIPGRPPVLCPGCPHRGLFYILNKLKCFVSGDIGCYTLGALPPLTAMDTSVCMGASVSSLHGRNRVLPEGAGRSVAVIGDSTFLHSGVTGLMNIAYNQSNSVVVILDNSITGMTGHQQNPGTGQTLKGNPAAAVSLEKLCEAVGIADIRVVDPYDLQATEEALKSALATNAPAVVISRRPCVLLKYVKKQAPLCVDTEKCVGCKMCMRIGCPAVSFADGKAQIDATLCVGCGVCRRLCKPRAIG
ncbi:MAG: indolepyruvate ferredoxin oxidoreductase subunit alpha [Oscillospiraceae bacterium]|jgi:indolepyruvate ferredoxin oxidoreductase alpha subunit|nr:indolepyruvate ferredoxin oxidoreductase subunit alpha [Oscillospiraceae bacterium]